MQQADWFLSMAIQVKVIFQSFYTLIGAAVGSSQRKFYFYNITSHNKTGLNLILLYNLNGHHCERD